jgi:hypothetical protein
MENPITAPTADPIKILTANVVTSVSVSPVFGNSMRSGGRDPTSRPTAAAGPKPRLRLVDRLAASDTAKHPELAHPKGSTGRAIRVIA